jgi:hypothetical protein
MDNEIDKFFEDHIVRILVDVKHYISDEEGNMLLTHTDTIETDSASISQSKAFNCKDKSVVIEAKEVRFYGKTNSPIHLIKTVKLN